MVMKKIIASFTVAMIIMNCMQLEYAENSNLPKETEIEEEIPIEQTLTLEFGLNELEQKNISFYEAILLCNKISIEENLDTLYEYSEKFFVDDSLFWLTNLKVRKNLQGYRLPTKEEWVEAFENGKIEKLDENIGEWLFVETESQSQFSVMELAPHFKKTVGLYKEREDYPIFGMRLVRVMLNSLPKNE
jgi:hypothetical protein